MQTFMGILVTGIDVSSAAHLARTIFEWRRGRPENGVPELVVTERNTVGGGTVCKGSFTRRLPGSRERLIERLPCSGVAVKAAACTATS
jgi:hypothetical protein